MYQIIYRTNWDKSIGAPQKTIEFSDLGEAEARLKEMKSYGWSCELFKA
jgi:hypothetical protein